MLCHDAFLCVVLVVLGFGVTYPILTSHYPTFLCLLSLSFCTLALEFYPFYPQDFFSRRDNIVLLVLSLYEQNDNSAASITILGPNW